FTATVLEDIGDGKGFVVPVSNQAVTVTLTNTNGAVASPAGPFTGTTNSSGQFQVTFTSATAGQVIGNTTTTFTVRVVTLTRATGDSQSGDSGPATKTFIDARISLTPSSTNQVGQPHTFTLTVLQDDGLPICAPNEDPSTDICAPSLHDALPILTNTNGAVASPAGPFTGTTNSSGQFQVTFTSN